MQQTSIPHEADNKLHRDLRVLARFVRIYCDDLHAKARRRVRTLKTHDLREIAGGDMVLCDECFRLLAHAITKRSHCPMNPKPMCKHCPRHCYHPDYRKQMQQVMRHSGKKIILRGRLDYILHYLM